MNKKYFIVFIFITSIIICLVLILFLYFNIIKEKTLTNNIAWYNDSRFKVEKLEETSTSSVQELCPKQQKMNDYICNVLVFTKPSKSEILFNSEIKKDKYVKYLRKAVDNFLVSGYILDGAYKDLVETDGIYLKSKFIIISSDDSMFGGKDIVLIPKDKPDKIFLAWVYGDDKNEPLILHDFKEMVGPPCVNDIQKIAINQLCNDDFGI